MRYLAAAGTYAAPEGKGLYIIQVDEKGSMKIAGNTGARDVGFLAADEQGRHIYATCESLYFRGTASGGISAYEIEDSGKPVFLNETATEGQMPCHLLRHGDRLYASSFLSGCISVHDILEDGKVSPVTACIRLDRRKGIAPSVHCTAVTPDGRYLCALDATGHRICFFRLDNGNYETAFTYEFPEPFTVRPRQAVFGERNLYVVTETGHELLTFRYCPETPEELLRLAGSSDLIPPEYRGKSRGSGIRLTADGKCLICSVRYTDVLTSFLVGEDGMAADKKILRTQGACPRDLDISPDGKWAIAGMQHSGKMELYRIDSGRNCLEYVSDIPGIQNCTGVRFLHREG